VVLAVVMQVLAVVPVHIKKVRLLSQELEQRLQFKLVVVELKEVLIMVDPHHILEHQ
jgi:hypothetical protein